MSDDTIRPIDLQAEREAKRPPRGEQPPRATGTGAKNGSTRKASSKPAAERPTQRSASDKRLLESVAGMYAGIGTAVGGIGMMRGDEGLTGTGLAMANMSEPVAEAWLDLAERNPRVKRALVTMTEASATGVLVGMHAMMLMPLLASRGVIPANIAAAASGNAATAAASNGNGQPDWFAPTPEGPGGGNA